MKFEIAIPDYDYPASWMIGPRTYAVDRMVPDVERIWFPPATHRHGGKVVFDVLETIAPAVRYDSRKKRLTQRLRPPSTVELGLFFDARDDNFFNWSHHVNFYMTLAIAARQAIGEKLIVVVRTGMPNILFDMYRLFGFEVVDTDGPVRGNQCVWSVPHWEIVPCGRKILAPGPFRLPDHDMPAKVYLARRGARSITNDAEVEAVLPGFTKIYAEDLSASEQFALWEKATHVVAIHGAGMAPMQYRSKPGLHLVEISPVGHATRWFGIMCHQVGGRYVQVRGRLKPEYVPNLYGPKPYFKHSGDDFKVDPLSLELALEIIQGDRAMPTL